METCPTCSGNYDEADTKDAEFHTKPINCSQTTRCRRCYGKPRCYFCQGCFCFCTSH